MGKSLKDALTEKPWSVSAIMSDINDILDDEGRPVSERRADAAARVGVEMEMRQCPFNDIRKDKWMNVSALEQISKYYNDVLAEMSGLSRQLGGGNASWDDIMACVIDFLAGPTIELLKQHSAEGPVTARIAVGHKLAAGMFGVMRRLYERLARGEDYPVTTDTFMQLIDEMEALVGASEACAGSLPMIRKAGVALLEGKATKSLEIDDPARIEFARCLTTQIELGVFWSMYDRCHDWSLLRGEHREHMTPYNDFLTRKLDHAADELGATPPPKPDLNRLPSALDPAFRQRLVDAINNEADPKLLKEDVLTATELLKQPGSAIPYSGAVSPMARQVANYLNVYRLFKEELSRLELILRGHLGYPAETPIRLGNAALPKPQALPWYESILGRHLGKDDHLTGDGVGVRVAN